MEWVEQPRSLDQKLLKRVLRVAVKTGRCAIGSREAAKYAKGAKLVVFAEKAPSQAISKVVSAAEAVSAPLLAYPGSSLELGELLGYPFRVAAISVRAPGDADLSPLLGAASAQG